MPTAAQPLTQTFIAGRAGFSAIEVLAVVYGDAPAAHPLTLSVHTAEGVELAARTFTVFEHNAVLRLDFPPVPEAAGRLFVLRIEGAGDQRATVWAYDPDGYPAGQLRSGADLAAGDLRFTTFYTLLWEAAGGRLLAELGAALGWALPAGLILFAPGWLILDLLRRRFTPGSAVEAWSLALALSLAAAPLAWQWTTVAGLRWGPVSLSAAYLLSGGVVLARALGRWRSAGRPRPPLTGFAWAWLAVLGVGLAARFLAVRDLAFPMWVDSPHHAVIARLLAETGQVPAGYQPVLPVEAFTYHFGFHVTAVALQWLTGAALPETFLWLGQVLNGLMPLAAGALAQALTGRRGAGLAGAFVVGLVSLFPAYYVSWGRYTQLTGLLVLAPLLLAAWRLGAPALSREQRLGWALMAAGLAAGLALVHYRVLVFFATFVGAVLLVRRGRGLAALLGAGAGAALLAGPWLARLAVHWVWPALQSPSTLAAAEGYNNFPVEYFRSELERVWLGVAGLGLLWGLARRRPAVWALGLWLALTLAVINLGPSSWLVNNNAWAISLFLPGAVLAGWAVAEVQRGAARLAGRPERWRRWLGGALRAGLIGGLAYAGLRGWRAQVAVVNPSTALAAAADAPALAWVAAHTPAEAVFLTNSWHWQGSLWAAPDGGAWLWPLAGRRTTMPPVDYLYQADWEPVVREFNERLAALGDVDAEAPEFLALLREAGVTHVYIGARGGHLKPEAFLASGRYRLLYSNGAAWVFAVLDLTATAE